MICGDECEATILAMCLPLPQVKVPPYPQVRETRKARSIRPRGFEPSISSEKPTIRRLQNLVETCQAVWTMLGSGQPADSQPVRLGMISKCRCTLDPHLLYMDKISYTRPSCRYSSLKLDSSSNSFEDRSIAYVRHTIQQLRSGVHEFRRHSVDHFLLR